MKKEIYIGIILVSVLVLGLYFAIDKSTIGLGVDENTDTIEDVSKKEFGYKSDGLDTNTAVKSIDLDWVLDGGPGKDGIPAIHEPKFFNIGEENNQKGLNDNVEGIAVSINGESKFYPYSILYWHEIVNDTIGGKDISITFCPLCGSAIVFDRLVDDELLTFGVSGKLYESNLLMYDDKTYSLWSQSIAEAVVGDYTGKTLDILKADLMSYQEFKENYGEGLVLSEETGYFRAYGQTPYGSYESDNDLYFPVANSDERLHKKELLYVMPYEGESYAFIREELKKAGKIEFEIGKKTVDVVYDNGIITSSIGKKVIPGYIEMFFSWATQHPENQNLWRGNEE